MSDITIPPAALEAAAKAMWKTDDPSQWEIGMARAALEAKRISEADGQPTGDKHE